MEKIKIQFIIENISCQETRNGTIQDEETGIHYLRKYLITTKPFNYRGKEYSQLEVYADSHLEFNDVGFIALLGSISEDCQKELKKHVWEAWWWENEKDSYYPVARTDESEKKIILTDKQLGEPEKFRFDGNSLTVSPTESGSRWDEPRGRLEVKIKPVKIGEKIIVNQLDFCVGKFFGDDVRQVIFDNFSPGKLVDIYFSEERHLGPRVELENNQTKLVISPFDLKNKFYDYSWFSFIDESNQPSGKEPPNFPPPPKETTISPSSSNEGNGFLPFLFIFVCLITLALVSLLTLQVIRKKKKKKTNKLINSHYGRTFSFSQH